MPTLNAPAISICMKVGAILGGIEMIPVYWTSPIIKPIIVTPKIANITPPLMRKCAKAIVAINATQASTAGSAVMSPRPTSVAGLATTIPAFFNAINARNKPIPAAIPLRIGNGIELMIHSLILNKLSSVKQTPDRNTAPNATSHV